MLWDLDICVDYDGILLIPFFTLTTSNQVAWADRRSFHQFRDLPPDIHLLIFQQCDSPTLFQLMHTSSYTRHECSRLFWAQIASMWCQCAWGKVDNHQQGRPGLVGYDSAFCARITQVEVVLGRLEWRFGDSLYGGENTTPEERVRQLWETVAALFPAARTVVLSGVVPHRRPPPRGGGSDNDYDAIARAASGCPPHITCLVSFAAQPRLGGRQTLWSIDSGLSWRRVDEVWCPPRLLIPRRSLAPGLLATYDVMRRKSSLYSLLCQGLDWLQAATYARYHKGPEIQCPAKNCDLVLVDQPQWEAHVLKEYHWRSPSWRPEDRLPCHPDTPDHVKAAMALRECHLEDLRSSVRKTWAYLAGEYDSYSTKKGQQFLTTFLEEMREQGFLAPGETLQQSQYCDGFMTNFEPTHVYYSGNPFASN
ncbi:hypothetical protein BJY00DRAFT_319969 [Aspergillus carlsbadensis]|nr:hypothetical protein BJY00DRAFT_319969 [Aspergillus carlsbadensis]